MLGLKGLQQKPVIASYLDQKVFARVFYESFLYIPGIGAEMLRSSRHRRKEIDVVRKETAFIYNVQELNEMA